MSRIDQIRRVCLYVGLASLLIGIGGFATQRPTIWRPAVASLCVFLPIGIGAIPKLSGLQFTAWIVSAFALAMLYPERFQTVAGINLHHPWLKLAAVQAVMFGMGTQMRIADFAGIARSPHAVGVGLVCQFTIMPLLGITLAKLFRLPPEVAAGVVLIGSCSSGLASNVMVYMSKGNLALSVTLTAVATMLAPLITPLWMKFLAGQFVEVNLVNMMISITKIVVVPIGAAFLHDYLKHAPKHARKIVVAAVVLSSIWIAGLVGWQVFGTLPANATDVLILSGFLCGAVVAGYVYHHLVRVNPWLESAMPWLSMVGIVYFTLIITVAGRDDLMEVGLLLFAVAVIHNTLGYCFGYGLSRLMGLDEQSSRTVAFEVGMQNGAMASGIADSMGKLGTVGLASAVFSPWMNVSGSMLANFLRRRAK